MADLAFWGPIAACIIVILLMIGVVANVIWQRLQGRALEQQLKEEARQRDKEKLVRALGTRYVEGTFEKAYPPSHWLDHLRRNKLYQLAHEEKELPLLIEVAEWVFTQHPEAAGSKTPEEHARWYYYMCSNIVEARQAIEEFPAQLRQHEEYRKQRLAQAAAQGITLKELKAYDGEELLLCLQEIFGGTEDDEEMGWPEPTSADGADAGLDHAAHVVAREREPLRQARTMETPDCLTPGEQDAFLQGRLSDERMRHADACPHCRAFLDVFSASDIKLANAILAETKKDIRPDCWQPHHFNAIVTGRAIPDEALKAHLRGCTRCQSIILAGNPDRKFLDALMA